MNDGNLAVLLKQMPYQRMRSCNYGRVKYHFCKICHRFIGELVSVMIVADGETMGVPMDLANRTTTKSCVRSQPVT